MLFLTSPNNPDGSIISEADLLTLLELPVLVSAAERGVSLTALACSNALFVAPNSVVLASTPL